MAPPLLHQRFPELAGSLPHLVLGRRPTPVRELAALAEPGRPAVWLKEDGLFGGVYGGNKVRKLEWLLADARRRDRRAILTFGGLATNFGLATALYAGQLGMATEIVLVDQPRDDYVEAQLERLRGAAILHFAGSPRRAAPLAAGLIARRTLADRRVPYVVGPGGSSPVGALGYVNAALELAAQVAADELPAPSHVVVAVGSGATAAGLALGLRLAGLRTRVAGVVVAHQLRLDARALARLARRTGRLLRRRGAPLPHLSLDEREIDVTREFLGVGYGHATAESTAAADLAREAEGLSLDPVYTAKALAGLLALRRRGFFGAGPVLFLNTYDCLSARAAPVSAPAR